MYARNVLENLEKMSVDINMVDHKLEEMRLMDHTIVTNKVHQIK